MPGIPFSRASKKTVITLQADNGQYLKRFYPFPYRPYSGITIYQDFVDPYSKFVVEEHDNGKITLQADNGQYLKRFCCWRGQSVIGIYQDFIDPYSYFTVEHVGLFKIRLKAENGQYLKRVYYNDMGGTSVVEVRDVKDQYGIFTVGVPC